MRRAQIIAFSGQGMRVQEISSSLGMNEEYLRELIRNFNDEGFDALRQRSRSGRPPSLTEEEESIIAEMATAPPQAFGRPFNQWSLRKLRDFLVEKKMIKPVSHNVIRRVLKNRKISYQRTRTWKRSNDPAYGAKKKRIKALYKKAPKGSSVICFDEFGPIQVKPQPGRTWAPEKSPVRHRATFRRLQGVSHFLAAYDVHRDRLWMHQKKRKRWQEVLSFLKSIRRRYPKDRHLYIVLDNMRTHSKMEVVDWCQKNNINFVFTATNASWMNRIECHFAPAKQFVMSNSDHPDHKTIGRAMQDYVRWRNKDAKNKKILKAQNKVRVL
tara:strand:+ start:216 stop:1193 length:978 start_codon:yes stop_codon:yes gene_type:complete